MSTRRRFLLGGATAAGALLVGYALWPDRRLARANRLLIDSAGPLLTNWIQIGVDDTVTIVIPHCDIGTGSFTALSQMAAEELDADWRHVRALTAPADPLFANGALAEGFLLEEGRMTSDSIPAFLQGAMATGARGIARIMDLQTTGGSSAVSYTGAYGMRIAGAAAREMLIKAAAARMNSPMAAFQTASSRVIHIPSGQYFRFGELAATAAHYPPSPRPTLKARSEYRLVGKPIKRLDVPMKVDGVVRYGIDMALPGMLYGAIRIAPAFGGTLLSVDEAPIAQHRGVKQVVRLADAVVVVADRYWRARDALSALRPIFDAGIHSELSSKAIDDQHRAAITGGEVKHDDSSGRGADALGPGPTVENTYSVPYLAHATMEPMSATVLAGTDQSLEVWAGTQDGLGARAFCAKAAKMPMDRVTFHLLPSGGGFGRRLPGQWNFLTYAVKTALAVPGVPVKLLFSREQDMQHDYYRPKVMSRFKARIAPSGLPEAWVNDYTTDDEANPEAHIIYDVPNQAYGFAKVTAAVPTGPWRGVEATWHGFFIESFIDELAHAARRDPLEYRRALLRKKPRHLATLELAAEHARWGAPLEPRCGRGIAIVECFGTIVAQVAEVSVSDGGDVKVRRVTAAADCGMAVNPDGFKAQIEGAIIFGLSAALHGQITIEQGAVVQSNFPDYRMVRLADCPAIEVHLHESDAPLGGGGEPGTPPAAPALANAIYAATGIRLRDLPIDNGALRAAGAAQQGS
jgi:isoquinoline 1-oxidoreductase beta subunit